MKTISNKTQRPLSVPLPKGKKLHLGPGKVGQIASKDADHPALKKLVEAGEIEILGEGLSATEQLADAKKGRFSKQGQGSGSVIRRSSGDR